MVSMMCSIIIVAVTAKHLANIFACFSLIRFRRSLFVDPPQDVVVVKVSKEVMFKTKKTLKFFCNI